MRGYEHEFVEVRDRTLNVKVNSVETKVRFRVSMEQSPTGLAAVAWSRNFEYISIKVFGTTYKNAATIIWTIGYDKDKQLVPKYGWCTGAEPEMWGSVNTLGYEGKRWTYKTPEDCIMGMVKYVLKCLGTGDFRWKI